MDTFSDEFRDQLLNLMAWRRDVRRFRTDPVDEAVLMRCLDTFRLAPSVGLSEPLAHHPRAKRYGSRRSA